MDAQVLTVSSKGQIFLPINIRKKLSIDTGDKLVVYASNDAIMLKTLRLPSADEQECFLAAHQDKSLKLSYLLR